MVADFSMRIAASNRIDSGTPLLFSLPPFRAPEPPAHFWQIIEHLGVERRRVLLVRTPIRVGRLYVLPQAERPFGGGPTRRHLALMDAITASDNPPERDLDYLFVSRARLAEGRFAGESYLEEMLLAAGVAVFHPETADLQRQLHLYRRARVLIFSEGSALHTLQLLGRLNAQLVVLVRRQGNQIAAASLGPRVPLLRYLPITQAQLYGLTRSGREDTRAGMSVIDEQRCIAGLKSLGIDLSPFWDSTAYSKRRDADIAAWISDRKTAGLHPREQAVVEEQLRALSLQIQ